MTPLPSPSAFSPPKLGSDLPLYPPVSQLLRVTSATVPGPVGYSQGMVGSSVLSGGLYVSFTQQMRAEGSLLPRDREPCLAADVNGLGLGPGFYIGRLCGSWTSLPVYEVVGATLTSVPGLGTVVEHTTNYTILQSDNNTIQFFDGSNLTTTLPGTVPDAPWSVTIINGGTTNLTINNNNRTINNYPTTILIGQGGSVVITSGGGDYYAETAPDGFLDSTYPRYPAQASTTTTLPSNTYSNGTDGVGATLTGTSNGAIAAQDGYIPSAGDVLLIKDEATTANNGLYTVTTVGTAGTPYVLTRSTNMNTSYQFVFILVFVKNGSTNKGKTYRSSTVPAPTVGTDSITFNPVTSATVLTVPQGGTGGQTPADALTGIGPGVFPQLVAQAATTTTLPANTYANGTLGVGATLTGNANGALAAQDGYTPVLNDFILVKNEVATANNGLYKLTTVGTGAAPYVLTRATTMDQAWEFPGALTRVINGTTNGGLVYKNTNSVVPVVGTTGITFSSTQTQPLTTIAGGGTGATTAGGALANIAADLFPTLTAQAATTGTLPANTYANGTAGVGATLTGNANGALTAQDGYTPVVNDTILVKNEATGANNGLYTLTQVGTAGTPYILTRTTTMDEPWEIPSRLVRILNGTTNGGSLFQTSNTTNPTIGTDSITFGTVTGPGVVTVAQGGTGGQTPDTGFANLGSRSIAFTGSITPSQITSDQNNYNPTGLSTASTLRISTDATRNITGLQGGSNGRALLLHNIGSNSLVLPNESGSSDAANRFDVGSDITIGSKGLAILQYDSTSSRWRVIALVSGGGGSPGGSHGDVQYKSGSNFGAEAALHYEPGSDQLTTPRLDVAKTFVLEGVVTDTITENKNDYTPVGIGTANTLRIEPSGASFTITGLHQPFDHNNCLMVLRNWSTAYNITLAHSSGSSSDGFRFVLPDSADYVVPPGGGVWLRYDEDQLVWTVISQAGAATQTQQEAATSNVVFTTPANQHYHPGHPKAWAYVSVSGGTPNLDRSYNTTSITDTGVGKLTWTIATDFSDAFWSSPWSIEDSSGVINSMYGLNTKAVGSADYHCEVLGIGFTDPTAWNLLALGDQS